MNRLAQQLPVRRHLFAHTTRPRIHVPKTRQTRGLIIPSIASTFLQVGEAISTLPLPEALPPYSAAIIATTIVLRSCTTLPLSLWSKHAMRRFRRELQDDLKNEQEKEGRIFKEEMRRKRLPINVAAFEAFKEQAGPKILAFQKKNVTRKLLARAPVMLGPVFINAAALVTFTLTLRHLSVPPTPFSTEVFSLLSESSLAQTDPFGILPGAIGVVAMFNTELRRALSPRSESSKKPGERSISAVDRIGSIIDGVTKLLSVAIVGFAMTNPVAVQIYWFTSFLYTTFENVLTSRLERRHTQRESSANPPIEETKKRAPR
ncbi:hypothetical protein DL93DRAFT_2079974 [Clavulina sp. PMI_390]|nr:hypothetical protein DL93DRAFT_2079974 [Clavulina sp. PMI_390]